MTDGVRTEVLEGLHRIDARFLGHAGHVAVYLLESDRPVLMDTAASTCRDTIIQAFETLPVPTDGVRFVIVSHLHLDHVGGAGYLLDEFPNATVLVHENGGSYLSDPDKIDTLVESAHRATGVLSSGYGDMKPVPGDRIQTLQPGDVIDLGDRSLHVIEASGHAAHQLAFFEPEAGWLYPADEAGLRLGDRCVPATPPPEFDLEATLESLRRFRELQPDHLVYPHFGVHGEPNAVIEDYETLLQRWISRVREVSSDRDSTDSIVEELMKREGIYPDLWDETTRRQVIRTDAEGVLGYLSKRE